MKHGKCSSCHRCGECSLQDLAVLTLPWVAKAIAKDGSEWDRAHALRRALRGTDGGSPGFVEDWLFAGAITRDDIARLSESLHRSPRVDLGMLTRSCRHYLGPQLPEDDWTDASAA